MKCSNRLMEPNRKEEKTWINVEFYTKTWKTRAKK